MATSKKDYIAVARIIASEIEPYKDTNNDEGVDTSPADVAIERIANRLADYFRSDNQLFNRDRFLKACGIVG